MDHAILQSHCEYFDKACSYWTKELLSQSSISLNEIERNAVGNTSGVYIIRKDNEILYIGKSSNLRTRICSQHLGPRKRSSTLRRKVSKHLQTDDEQLITDWLKTTTIAWLELGHHGLSIAVEDHAITANNPPFNGYT